MPKIETSIWIKAPLDRVYAITRDNKSFPDFMPDVKSLTVLESSSERVLSEWIGIIPNFGLKIRWKQEDLWDDAKKECTFRQVEGDYDKLEGCWKLNEENGGTRFASDLEYEFSVPGVGLLVKKIIHNLAVKNIEGILNAIKSRAEATDF